MIAGGRPLRATARGGVVLWAKPPSASQGRARLRVCVTTLPLPVIGNLVDDPELRFTSVRGSGGQITVASIPCTFDRDTNSWRDGEPTFLDCSAWRQLAEDFAESLIMRGQMA
ncbi:single-stranded DNA-binding protein [Streptomyces sp. JCM17656]|nr:single-stranded DNA-binding protein [Streptomyces sp. JCM17656]